MAGQDPIQQSGVVATLGGFPDNWEKISGGIPSIAYVEHYEGGAKTPDHLPGTTSYSDITLSRAYKPGRDEQVVAWHKRFALGLDTPRTITKQFLNYQGVVTGFETFAVCKPISCETPEGTAGDNNVAMITVVLKVTQKL